MSPFRAAKAPGGKRDLGACRRVDLGAARRHPSLMIVPEQRLTTAEVSHHYDELDAVYRRIWGDHLHHGYWRTGRESVEEAVEALVELVAERLALEPDMRLCDIGCGYGAGAEQLASTPGADVTGFTVSESQFRIARLRVPAAGAFTCFHRDWLANGMDDARFDRACAIESSEHMVDKVHFFTEAWRVLRPGGRLVVCAWLTADRPGAWSIRHLLEPICREGRLPGMGSRADYEAMAETAGLELMGFEDIGRSVRRTWSICARRVGAALLADPAFRRFAFSPHTANRDFLLSIPRLILALRTGAMRYGIFTWRKPPQR